MNPDPDLYKFLYSVYITPQILLENGKVKGSIHTESFFEMYLSVRRKYISSKTRCYGNGRTRIVLAVLAIAEMREHSQKRVHCVQSVRNSF